MWKKEKYVQNGSVETNRITKIKFLWKELGMYKNI